MNRFRTKKKLREEAAPRPSHDSESSTPFRLFGKSRKQHDEGPKKEINISTALPSNDDFRTSLLMTGLSARFSMLKEQDDPNTKIGKASDDSVLFPKRQSRMDLAFGGGLGDIAEVESIRAQPPFARMDSFHSSEGSTSGSIMDRVKPTEGNNLFGGRQKIYKIPAGVASKDGSGMGGKALYESDVAMSSFQRWRQAERQRKSPEGDRDDRLEPASAGPRGDSPPPNGHNRKRETNSTTSSTPSIGHNSTAATSVVSQPTTSLKDWQNPSSASTSNAGTPVLERSVTRTRRLYETGLMNDLQESQSSALSRMDTLSRPRNLGTRTPEPPHAPSPTGNPYSDRFGDRKILTKASAPNLRSMSPPMTGSSIGAMDLGIRVPNLPESKSVYTSNGTPPLSPPTSEIDESGALSIQPNDRGKATALGVFQRPTQPYDEARYAQKQLQLQQGRETPTNRFRAESTTSHTTTTRSRSSSSAQRLPFERSDQAIKTEPTVKEESNPSFGTFLDTDDDLPPPPVRPQMSRAGSSSPAGLQRPSDRDHPAFREVAVPTPLSLSSKLSDGPSPISEQPDLSSTPSQQDSPNESPTLGPPSGLSGIVRQHLRSDSDASSVYGAPAATGGINGGTNGAHDQSNTKGLLELDVPSNPWELQSPDWHSQLMDDHTQVDLTTTPVLDQRKPGSSPSSSSTPGAEPRKESDREHDEFARHLADGARRVRERLTSYVESDSRSTSPQPPESRDGPSSRSNALSLLKSRSIRAPSTDRSRSRDGDVSQPAKATKMLGIGASTISSSPSPSKRSFDLERDPLSPMEEEPEGNAERTPSQSPPEHRNQPESSAEEKEVEEEKDEGMHAGLRAFRQARRELQKLKEMETQQRHQPPPSRPGPQSPPSRERPQAHRSPSGERERERRPPPVTYQQRAPSEESKRGAGGGTPYSSRPPSRTDRERSGSENSTGGGRSHSRPPRLRNTSAPYEGLNPNMNINGPPHGRSGPRPSPGLPGTDIRRSPIMPPQGYPAPLTGPPTGPLPGPPTSHAHADRPGPHNLRVHAQQRGHDSNQPSPISPMAPMPSPFANSAMSPSASTPNLVPSPRRPSAPPTPNFDPSNGGSIPRLDETMKRQVRKKDISEPTFVSSTSRVPTVNLPEDTRMRNGTRSRSGSMLGQTASTPNLHAQANAAMHAPPLPPINPKRRNMMGFRGRKPEDESGSLSPQMPLSPHNGVPSPGDSHSAFSISDEEDGGANRERRRLRKATSEAHGMNMRARQAQLNGSQAPPVPTTSAPRLPGGMI